MNNIIVIKENTQDSIVIKIIIHLMIIEILMIRMSPSLPLNYLVIINILKVNLTMIPKYCYRMV